ncbi:kinase [Clostridium niameyense]|uniref:Kinase n=1 Tax=Clostridium niameyense TaxID=1622073 RepID=A0A6M0R9P9_9CLOT|nr:kinase [Clostridium niameyense]NEZ46981.1 kinase [Clostridium niameyense]
MEFRAKHPGSFGEILQGTLGEKSLLVSTPINLYTNIRIFESYKGKKTKTNIKVNKFMEILLLNWGYKEFIKNIHIEIKSEIPRGKGLASSTADICAVYKALTNMFKKPYSEKELILNSVKVEPTDSIIFDKFTLFDYKTGKFKEELGNYIKFYILVFQGNKIINTIEFNKRDLPPMESIEDLIPKLRQSILKSDLRGIGEISTESIKRNFTRLNYDYFDLVSKYKNETNGLGIVGCHSGDALGIIYDNKQDLIKSSNLCKKYKGLNTYTLETLINI